MSERLLPVLDKGYVRLVDVMGTDLSVANAARASFAKEHTVLQSSDERLIAFLIKHGHLSPFRHAFLSFELRAPLLVARQLYKYIVGSDHTMEGWNESSRRYVTEEPTFYMPEQWREAPENKKQGSGAAVDPSTSANINARLENLIALALTEYDSLLEDGIAPEQARLFLPAYGMYVTWRWSCSLQSALHLLDQRLADDAQWETQQYAKAVAVFVEQHFPVCFKAVITNGL